MSLRPSTSRQPFLTVVALVLLSGAAVAAEPPAAADSQAPEQPVQDLEADVTQGALRTTRPDGAVVECPLRHTDVQADISGFIARVRVTQTFYNPADERIEAVYVFPLPHQAAVDEMTMVVGSRKIVGLIKRRLEARQIYEQALAAGQTAALLEQERPNIFTQSVGNIGPGEEVKIEIQYVDVLDYDLGRYEFYFPMVVGPRFNPGAPLSPPPATPAELAGAVSPPVPDTTRVPDASRISPPVLKPGLRNGHDISLALRLDAGVPIQGIEVANHQAAVVDLDRRRAEITLDPADAIPNKDFVVRYQVSGKKPELAVLSHTGDHADAGRWGQGYFLLMIQPREDERLTKSPPREIVFLLDVSGSMSGPPTEKVKDTMRHMLALCREVDTLQVITFASRAAQLFEAPVPVTRANVDRALNFTRGLQGGGGTQMLEGVKRAIDQPLDPQRVRIVIMLTDGYIGNEQEIIQHVGQQAGDQVRFWAVGIGSSPNMFLIDGVARQGGGGGQRLGLEDNAAGLAEEVVTRIQRAQLTKIQIDWGGLQVAETYPAKLPELWAGRPVIVLGRYAGGGQAEIQVRGQVEGEPVQWPLQVSLRENEPAHDVLAKVWARRKIEDLMQQTYYAGSPAVEEEVTAIALDYGLMTQYTSFVAVDAQEAERPAAAPPRRMLVPVPLPAGTRWEGFFGPTGEPAPAEVQLSRSPALGKRLVQSAPGVGPAQLQLGFRQAGLSELSASAASAPFGGVPARRYSSYAGRAGRDESMLPASPRTRGVVLNGPVTASFSLAPAAGGSGGSIGGGLEVAERVSRESLLGDRLQLIWGDPATATQYALAAEPDSLLSPATRLLEAGRGQLQQKQRDPAQACLAHAYLLATAAANHGSEDGGRLAAEALLLLEPVRRDQLGRWQEQIPALGKKLELVLRDQSIEEALRAVAEATGLKIELIAGSLDDAREMLAGQPARVAYLDLRGASAAEALDWMLLPLRLTWRPRADAASALAVGSARRLPGSSAWVYDVSVIALPAEDVPDAAGDWNQRVAAAKAEADQFLTAIRSALQSEAEETAWFAPGHLLVAGDPVRHQRLAGLLAQLGDPQAQPPADLAALHAKTSRRAEQRREQLQERRQAQRLLAVAAAHQHYAWQLLTEAYHGSLDGEALTELQIAWAADQTQDLLAKSGPGVALRSAWAVGAAAGQLPGEPELARFALAVRQQSAPAAATAVATFQENRQDVTALLTALYGCLAADDAELTERFLGALLDDAAAAPPLAAAAYAARMLLSAPGSDQISVEPLLDGGGLVGEDLAALVAIACRRAGGDRWTAFRVMRGDLLGRQPLPGSVVVLINRL